MTWICPRCQSKCDGDFCFNCGQPYTQGVNVNGSAPSVTSDPAIAELRRSIKTLKIMCIVLISVVALMSIIFACAYLSVWENIEDLWTNAEDLWYNAEELWESSESLWEYRGYYYWY